jgi:hypothetical protein
MRSFPLVISVVIIGLGVITGVPELQNDRYTGKIAFASEGEYSDFKRAIAAPAVEYQANGISVLSSEPPIVVQFTVKTPSGYNFPYGTHDSQVKYMSLLMSAVLIFGGIALALVEIFWKDDKKPNVSR